MDNIPLKILFHIIIKKMLIKNLLNSQLDKRKILKISTPTFLIKFEFIFWSIQKISFLKL